MITKISILLKASFWSLVFLTGCASSPSGGSRATADDRERAFGFRNIETNYVRSGFPDIHDLSNEAQPEVVDLSKAKIVGYLSRDDSEGIRKSLSKIKGVDYVVDSLELVWGVEPVAALAQIGPTYVFLTKDVEEKWNIVRIQSPQF